MLFVNADTVIGEHVIINTSAVVEHDNRIGDYVHISPGAMLAGVFQWGGKHM
ncbi:Tetrahydrodipicolinate N-succinyltransferase [Staphylococcus gallinarum]|uniref:Tetrahydrodipicolinate N-succinyltransferase n=1 Tax=Staphylococcus gallinarum TaxID=1293 RepID=A0A380FCE2_STAGA|nr:Tetrahydrodipicolinate N-succinyltransferase [Staphylococcus gallinarum]